MRVLGIRPGPWYSVADVYRGLMRALGGLGCTTVDFNLDDRLNFYEECQITRDGETRKALSADAVKAMAAKGIEAACYEVWPDVVLVVSGFFVPRPVLELMRNRGHTVILVHTESPYEDDRQLTLADAVNINALNDPTNLERFRDVCPGTVYLPHAYDPTVHHRRKPRADLASDFCFVGTGYPSRVRFFEEVEWNGYTPLFAGNWQELADNSPLHPHLTDDATAVGECIDNTDAVDLYCSTRASANLYRREANTDATAEGWSMSPREVELAACETFYMTEARGENRAALPMIPTFDGPADFTEKLGWWLDHDDARTRVVTDARAAIDGRTFDTNAKTLLRLATQEGNPNGA